QRASRSARPGRAATAWIVVARLRSVLRGCPRWSKVILFQDYPWQLLRIRFGRVANRLRIDICGAKNRVEASIGLGVLLANKSNCLETILGIVHRTEFCGNLAKATGAHAILNANNDRECQAHAQRPGQNGIDGLTIHKKRPPTLTILHPKSNVNFERERSILQFYRQKLKDSY